jgi:amphiphysin
MVFSLVSRRLNIFYIMVEKLQAFAEGKYEVPADPGDIAAQFLERFSGAQERVEALGVIKRVTSTGRPTQSEVFESQLNLVHSPAKMMATRPGATVGRANTTSSNSSSLSSVSRTPSAFTKKAPPPPPSAPAAPPPYSASSASTAAAVKRPPPPPPALKPKPKPSAQYVVALYDFQAQADGDLDFNTGDRIEIVEKTASQEDWWTGKLNGRQGVFPGAFHAFLCFRRLQLTGHANQEITFKKLNV